MNYKTSNLLFYMLAIYFLVSVLSNILIFMKGTNSIIMVLMSLIMVYGVKYYNKNYLSLALIILFIFTFQSLYVLLGQIRGYDFGSIFFLSKYLLAFAFFPIIYYLIEKDYIDKIIKIFSKILFIKILIMTVIIINVNFIDFYKTEIFNLLYNYTNLKPYTPVPSFTRVFDSFAPFFPLLIYYILDKNKLVKTLLHVILFIYIFYVGSVGIWFTYFIILLFVYFKITIMAISASLIILSIFFYGDVNIFLEYKMTSMDIKSSQINYLLNNLSIFGYGVGFEFNIGDRKGVLIENLILYLILTYGIFGFVIYFAIFILYPFYIFIKHKTKQSIYFLGLTYLSIVLSSVSNPYLMSGTSMVIMMIIVSYEVSINKKGELK
jgi:hypothetical protein